MQPSRAGWVAGKLAVTTVFGLASPYCAPGAEARRRAGIDADAVIGQRRGRGVAVIGVDLAAQIGGDVGQHGDEFRLVGADIGQRRVAVEFPQDCRHWRRPAASGSRRRRPGLREDLRRRIDGHDPCRIRPARPGLAKRISVSLTGPERISVTPRSTSDAYWRIFDGIDGDGFAVDVAGALAA